MLINSQCVAEAPSRRAATAGSQRVTTSGLGAVVRERGRGDLAADAGWMSGIRLGGGNAAAGYLPDRAGGFRPGQPAGGPVQASAVQLGVAKKSTVQKSTVQKSTVQNSTVQNSTYQHNSIQVTRLVPAIRGGVGPHPVREPGPA